MAQFWFMPSAALLEPNPPDRAMRRKKEARRGRRRVVFMTLFALMTKCTCFSGPLPPRLVRNADQKGMRSQETHWKTARPRSSRQALPDGLQEMFASAQSSVTSLPDYVKSAGPGGTGLFFLVFVALECFSLPASPLMLSSGYIFGLAGGFAISIFALVTAASISFALARTVLKPQLTAVLKDNDTFRDVNRAVQVEGFKIVALLRLAPVLPFALSNYAYGSTQLGFLDFVLATAIGCSPGTFAAVYFATAATEAGAGSDTPWYYYAGGALATAVLLKLVTDIAQRAVQESIDSGSDDSIAAQKVGKSKDEVKREKEKVLS